jgi:hypothetical protein
VEGEHELGVVKPGTEQKVALKTVCTPRIDGDYMKIGETAHNTHRGKKANTAKVKKKQLRSG